MTSKELNLKLTKAIPEISDMYYMETSWQEGDDTGSHVVYEDVLVPFIKEQLTKNNKQLTIKVFDYIESLLGLNDEYVNEVVAFSVIESLLLDDEIERESFIQYVKENTFELIKETLTNI